MSKTRSNFHLELNEEQKSNVTNEEPRQMSMRERRMRRRAGMHGSSTVASVETAPLPARIRREIRQEMGNVEAEGDVMGDALSQLEAQVPQQAGRKSRDRLETGQAGKHASSQLESQLATQPASRKKRKGKDLEPELIPSPPSAPLGTKPKSQPTTETPVTAESLARNKLQGFNWYWDTFPPTIAQKTTANTFFNTHGRAAKLLRSVAQFRLFPESDVPEVAFVGRSNVGKSSLLNAVMGADIKALLARTSSTPGFTKTMNLYGVGAGNGVTIKKTTPNGREKIVGIGGMTIVDMPGYGEGSLASWGAEIMKYITNRKQLRRVFVLIDAEHGIKDKDRSLLASLRLAGVSHQVILSKLDRIYIPNAKEIRRHDGKALRRLSPKGTIEELRKAMEKLKADIQPPVGGGALGEVLGVSAETMVEGKRLGVDHVRFAVLKAVGLDSKYQKESAMKKESGIDQNTLSWK
jgi:GTP-binding protein